MQYDIRSDLLIEALSIDTDGIVSDVRNENNLTITTVDVIDEDITKKKKGKYITIEFNDINSDKENLKIELRKSLEYLFKINNIMKDSSVLVIGLGNAKSTADSLGPLVIDNIIVTRHLEELGYNNMRTVSAIKPGVKGETGIETKDIIKGIIDVIKPDFIIAIDSLASSSISRINKTIQLTDTGIHPGSGVGNKREELSKDTISIPVIAIGIPTVCDAVTIVNDTIEEVYKHFAITTKSINNPVFKMTPLSSIKVDNYTPLNKDEKEKLSGLIGTLSYEDRKALIYEVLLKTNYNLMVTPKEIDFIIDKLSDLISIGINEVLHDYNL
jgi:spore protease